MGGVFIWFKDDFFDGNRVMTVRMSQCLIRLSKNNDYVICCRGVIVQLLLDSASSLFNAGINGFLLH